MTTRAIFFDWGGVIATDPGDGFLRELLLSIGATEKQVEEIFATYHLPGVPASLATSPMLEFMKGHTSEKVFWENLRKRYGLTVHDSISEEFLRWKGLVADNDILALVHQARENGLKVAVLTNTIEPTYNVIQQAGYYDLFDDVIASCKVGYVKPEEEIYTIALTRLEVRAEESIFIDDKTRCLEPAAAMGFTTILATSPQQIIKDVNAIVSLR